jgi:hypothetical protein
MPVPNSKRRVLFPWRPVAIYAAVVIIAGAGLVFWDRAYEARRTSPDTPPLVAGARNLVEGYVGAGTVQSTRLDPRTGTLTMEVRDVVSEKGKTPGEKRDLLSGEGTGAVNRILGKITFQHIVLKLVKDGKTLATVRSDAGKDPRVEFAPDVK